jgi:hypothetical protein
MKKTFEEFSRIVSKYYEFSPKTLMKMFKYYSQNNGSTIISVIVLNLLKLQIEASENQRIELNKISKKILREVKFL